jgi:hypothetical protein
VQDQVELLDGSVGFVVGNVHIPWSSMVDEAVAPTPDATAACQDPSMVHAHESLLKGKAGPFLHASTCFWEPIFGSTLKDYVGLL